MGRPFSASDGERAASQLAAIGMALHGCGMMEAYKKVIEARTMVLVALDAEANQRPEEK